MQAEIGQSGQRANALPRRLNTAERRARPIAGDHVLVAREAGEFRQQRDCGGRQDHGLCAGFAVRQARSGASKFNPLPTQPEHLGEPGAGENQQPPNGDCTLVFGAATDWHAGLDPSCLLCLRQLKDRGLAPALLTACGLPLLCPWSSGGSQCLAEPGQLLDRKQPLAPLLRIAVHVPAWIGAVRPFADPLRPCQHRRHKAKCAVRSHRRRVHGCVELGHVGLGDRTHLHPAERGPHVMAQQSQSSWIERSFSCRSAYSCMYRSANSAHVGAGLSAARSMAGSLSPRISPRRRMASRRAFSGPQGAVAVAPDGQDHPAALDPGFQGVVRLAAATANQKAPQLIVEDRLMRGQSLDHRRSDFRTRRAANGKTSWPRSRCPDPSRRRQRRATGRACHCTQGADLAAAPEYWRRRRIAAALRAQ